MKKTLVLLMLVLLMAFVAACNREPAVGESETPNVPAPNQPIEEEPEDEPVVTQYRDLNRTIRVACWWTYMPETGSDPPDPATASNYHNERLWYENQRRVEENFNVRFENLVIPWEAGITNLTASVLAGDPFAEWVMLPGDHMIAALLGELALSTDQFASPTSDLMTNQRFVEQRVSFQGDLFGFGRAERRVQSTGMGVNLDIIRAVGAPNPVDLWNDGLWTWDAMREVMALATRDTTGDGNIDQFGLSGYVGSLMRNFIATNNGLLVDESTLTYAMDDPRTITALEFMGDIFTNGWWNWDQTGSTPVWDWGRNTWIYQEGQSALFPLETWMVAEQGVGFDFAIVPFPRGPEGGQYHTMAGFYHAILIPTGTYRPEDIFYVYEELQSWARHDPNLFHEGTIDAMRRYWPTEGDVYRVIFNLGDLNTRKFDLGFAIPEYTWIFGTIGYNLFTGAQTPMQIIEEQRPIRQEMIDNAFAGF